MTPLVLNNPANPEGAPLEVLDGLRDGLATDRSPFSRDLAVPCYGANRAGAEVRGIEAPVLVLIGDTDFILRGRLPG